MDDSNEETSVELSEEINSPPPKVAPVDEGADFMHGSALTAHTAAHGEAKKGSLCMDIFMVVVVVGLFVTGLVVILVANNWRANDPYEIAKIYHEKHPFIDGKNQLPYAIKTLFKGDMRNLNLRQKVTPLRTDLPRIREGKLGGAVWSASVPCGLLAGNEGPAAVQRVLYQMDIIQEMIDKYSSTFEEVDSEEQAHEAFSEEKKLPSMISLDGGHSIHDDLGVLRMFHKLGVISMSLTAECSTAWAQSGNPYNAQYQSVQGLTEFGVQVIREMNRMGMLVDLSYTAPSVMQIGLQVSEAPVIFSLSGAGALANSSLNVPSSLYKEISKNGAVIMVPLWAPAICSYASELYDQFRSGAINSATLLQLYTSSTQSCTIEDVFLHVDHLKSKLGVSHIGISTNFDNNLGLSIKGLEDTSKLIYLTARFVKARYSEADISNIIGGNLLRTMSVAESVGHHLTTDPILSPIILAPKAV